MTYLEIEIGGVAVAARLLDQRTPHTCAALLKALPFTGRAVHTLWSGNLIHVLDTPPLVFQETEAPVGFQYPGLIMYSPTRHELAICYDDARYRFSAGPEYVTPVAEVQGDLTPLIGAIKNLQFEGAKPITFSSKEGEPLVTAEPRIEAGDRLEIELDGKIVTARLLEESAPRTTAAFKSLLPLTGYATNTKWSGPMAHFWGPVRANRGSIGLHVDPVERPTMFHLPGYLYHYPEWDGLRIPVGDAHMSGAFRVAEMTPFAKFEGDWSSFRETGSNLYITGARPMSIRLLESERPT